MAKAKAKSKNKIMTKSKPEKAQPKKNKKLKAKPGKTVKPLTKAKVQVAKPSKSIAKTKTKLVDLSEFVTPLDDRIIVQASESEKVTPGGIIIPDTISTAAGNRKGVVLAVGRGHCDKKGRVRPMDVKAGDKIIFPDFTGSKLIYLGQDLIILRETDVMGVLD